MPVAEAAWRAVAAALTPGDGVELEHVRHGGVVVMGAPNMVAEGAKPHAAGGGGGGGGGGAKKKKDGA